MDTRIASAHAVPGAAADSTSGVIEAMFAASHECMKLLDAEGRITAVNPRGMELLDITDLGLVRGKEWAQQWPDDVRDAARDAVHRALAGAPASFTAFRATYAGRPKWWDVSVAPVYDRQKRVVCLVSAARDLMRQTTAADVASAGNAVDRSSVLADLAGQLALESRRLSDMQRALTHAEKLSAIGEFVGVVAHDINNVLCAVTGLLALAKRRLPGNDLDKLFDQGQEAIQNGSRLLRQLLDFSRDDHVDVEIMQMAPALADLQGMVSMLIGSRIGIETAAAPDAWPVLIRPAQFKAAMLNLAANSRDAMPDGGTLSFSATNVARDQRPAGLPPSDYVRVEVRDTGCGMTAEVARRAGTPFFTTKKAGVGTGLGLSSAFKLAQGVGGRATVVSAPGKGTSVLLYLPRSPVLPDLAQTADDRRVLASHGGATVLLAIDDAGVRQLVGQHLRQWNYTVLEAGSVAQANVMVSDLPAIDVLIFDNGLSEKAAMQAIEQFRAVHARLPVLLIGEAADGSADDGNADDGLSADDLFRLTRPLGTAQLGSALLSALGRVLPEQISGEVLRRASAIEERIRHPALRTALHYWRALVERNGCVPGANSADDIIAGAREIAFIAAIQGSVEMPIFRYEWLGAELCKRIGRDLTGEMVTEAETEIVGSLHMAYRRAARGLPCFDYAQVRLGQGKSLQFERVLLPLSSDGQTVTHLAGLVFIETTLKLN